MITYIMLNPSTADNHSDDKTIRRLVFFTKKFGFGGFYVGNLYPIITPFISELYEYLSHDKMKNRKNIKFMIEKSEQIVYAWGNTIKHTPEWINKIVKNPMCFGQNKNGSPKHPLYLKNSSILIGFK